VKSAGFDAEEDWVTIPKLDWVGIKAFVPASGSPISGINISEMNECVQAAMNKIPIEKQIVLVMMAYTRDGQWTNIDTLRDLQVPTYLLAYNNPRVIGLRMYTYYRFIPGTSEHTGTYRYTDLVYPHKLIYEKIKSTTLSIPEGRRTLSIIAYDTYGDKVDDSLVVTVCEQ
jgi:hypothetical protein